jgi:MFS family permease
MKSREAQPMHHRPNTNYPAMAPATHSRSNLRTGLIEGLFSTPFTVVSIPGGFLLAALLTQWFGIDKSAFGWIVSLPSWANALQVLALPALARLVTSKDLALGMGWLNAVLWAMLVASLPFLPKNDPAATAMFFGVFFALASASGAFHTVGWTVWIREWVPRRLRGAYLGKRNSLISAATLGFLLLSVAWLEAQKNSLVPYLGILAVMVACRAFSLLWQHGIRTRHDNSPLAAPPLHHSLAECRATPGLVPFILFSAWMNFWMAFTGPFTAVFAFDELHLDPGAFAFLTAIGTVSGVVGWSYWGRVTDRAGAIPVIAIGSALWEISNILWAVLVPENSWLLYPMFLWGGFFAVSFFMGSFNLLLNLVPSKSGAAAVGLQLAVTSAAMAVAPILSGSLLEIFVTRQGGGIGIYHLGFAIKSIGFLAGLLILLAIPEPGRTTRQTLPGAFRSVRQAMLLQGLELFANLTPFRNKPRQKNNPATFCPIVQKVAASL